MDKIEHLHFRQVECGYQFALFLDSAGGIWGFGDSSNGELAFTEETIHEDNPNNGIGN